MDDAALWSLRVAVIAAVNVGFAVLVGSLASLRMLRSAKSPWALRRAGSTVVGLKASVAWSWVATAALLWTQGAEMSGQPLLDALGSVGTVLRRTHFGHAWAAGATALLVLTIGMLLAWYRIVDRRHVVLWWVCVAAYAASRSSAGHAGATGALLPLVVDWMHLLCVSAWAGVVFIAAGAILRKPIPADPVERGHCASYVESLSRAATWALAAVLVTGSYGAWRSLDGALGPLVSSTYGEILLFKLAWVAIAIALGAHNRLVAMPRLLAALRAPPQPFDAPLRAFRRVLQWESIALLAALAAAAALSLSAPPAGP